MKLWAKQTHEQTAATLDLTSLASLVEEFTVGRDRELDAHMAAFDVLGSLAHTQMLTSIGLMQPDELREVQRELRALYAQVERGEFVIEPGIEDVHSQVELVLTRLLGDVGKKIHSGRSRNDQVLVDVKLFVRSEIRSIVLAAERLFERLLALSVEHKDVLLPGYTHLQIAMPSSFGLWFGSYAESLADDVIMLHAAYRIANKNPLGSAAGYGSSFPLSRRMTTELLGFDDLNYNVVYAQMGRGKTERIAAQALASVAATLGKLAMDVTLYLSQNFGFISFPDELTTGSSIMPHKKNPDVFELMRARCNRLQALPNDIVLLTSNLPSGYHRDFQMLKEALFPAFEELRSLLGMAELALRHIRVAPAILDDEKYAYLFSVEAVNRRVLAGMPFRDAYRAVGEDIANGRFDATSEAQNLHHTHEGSIGALCTDEVRAMMRREIAAFHFERVDAAVAALVGSAAIA
jgi:argininosuccinate lyase